MTFSFLKISIASGNLMHSKTLHRERMGWELTLWVLPEGMPTAYIALHHTAVTQLNLQ